MRLDGLAALIDRVPVPQPWAEGETIPWNEPGFSARMLREHLSQDHDAASRRTVIIEQHVAWIHDAVLKGRSSHILDLGCGPGLYAERLAALGHVVTGIDFSPASIAYAREQSAALGSNIIYNFGDLRQTDFGVGFDLVMFIFGEFNVFQPADAQHILAKACDALKPGGQLLLEVSTVEGVVRKGHQPPNWYTRRSGLFSDRPYLCLTEHFWDAEAAVATERYFILDAGSAELTRHTASTQAYSNHRYASMLRKAGFGAVRFEPALTGNADDAGDFFVVIGTRPATG